VGNPLKYVDPTGRDAIDACSSVSSCTGSVNSSINDSDPWGGTTTNPFTGLNGLGSLVDGSAFLSSLSSLGNLAYLGPGDFSIGRTASVSGQGLAAFADGVIPFIDPFERAGVYDPDELGLEYSRAVGSITRDIEISLAATGSSAIFGKGKWINQGRKLRIGHSEMLLKGQANRVYFSLRGEWVVKASRFFGSTARAPHWNLWVVRYLR
jgi:hypothetical protein